MSKKPLIIEHDANEVKEVNDAQMDIEEAVALMLKNGDLPAVNEIGAIPLKIKERSVEALEIQRSYGNNEPYNRYSAINYGKLLIKQTAESMLELGNVLVNIKENEPHGEFVNIIENDFKLGRRTAQKMMQASVKFLKLGEAKANTYSLLNKAKLFELMTEDDDALDALAEGGTVAGLTLDDIDKLSVRELKAKLKEERENNEAIHKVLSDKDRKINEMEAKLSKADIKQKRELKIDSTVTLTAEYKEALALNLKDMFARINQCEQIFKEAQDHALPAAFFKSMAFEIGTARDQLNDLLSALPSDTAPIDTAWLADGNHESTSE